ncbi:MAG: Crp/Fnr family transcriptional regulator [Candidatus Saccharimonadales bacterium]
MSLTRSIKAKQTVFYQGEAVTKVYRLNNGLVRSYIIHDNGDESTIAFFGPYDIFPITSAYDITPVTLFYYETVVDSVVTVYDAAEFAADSATDPQAELRRFATRYVGALLHVSALAQQTASLKLAHTLRYLAVRFGEKLVMGSRTKVTIKLTQHDLAALSNLSRETVSIELTKLKRQDIISVKAKYYYINLAKLNAMISQESMPITLQTT